MRANDPVGNSAPTRHRQRATVLVMLWFTAHPSPRRQIAHCDRAVTIGGAVSAEPAYSESAIRDGALGTRFGCDLFESKGLGAPRLREQSRPVLADKPHPEGARNALGGNHADQSYRYFRPRDACLPRRNRCARSAERDQNRPNLRSNRTVRRWGIGGGSARLQIRD